MDERRDGPLWLCDDDDDDDDVYTYLVNFPMYHLLLFAIVNGVILFILNSLLEVGECSYSGPSLPLSVVTLFLRVCCIILGQTIWNNDSVNAFVYDMYNNYVCVI